MISLARCSNGDPDIQSEAVLAACTPLRRSHDPVPSSGHDHIP